MLDALIAGVNIVELDPLDDSVGYGGLPNADGVVQLDSCCMHGPKRRAGGVACARRSAHALARGEGGDGADRSSPDCRQGRAEFCPRARVQDRGRPQHGEFTQALAGMETADRSVALSRPGKARQGGPRSDATNGGGRVDRFAAHLWHDQLQRNQREGRDLRRDDDQRPGLEDSGTRWRFADSGRGALRGWADRRRGLDWSRRSESLQSLFFPDRGEHAARHASEGRRTRRAARGSRRIRSRNGCSTAKATRISGSTSTR